MRYTSVHQASPGSPKRPARPWATSSHFANFVAKRCFQIAIFVAACYYYPKLPSAALGDAGGCGPLPLAKGRPC